MAVAILFTAPASAQVKFGLKGGIDATSLKLNESVFDESNRVGSYGEVYIAYRWPWCGCISTL